MTLGFKQEIAGKPTWFVEKIWQGLRSKLGRGVYTEYRASHRFKIGSDWDIYSRRLPTDPQLHAKLHTIREDKNSLWSAGKLIHPVINNRSANRFQFAPTMQCLSVQDIKFSWHEVSKKNKVRFCNVLVSDGAYHYQILKESEVVTLAINDGFDSVEDFFAWFNKDFTGKIIHWTDLKY